MTQRLNPYKVAPEMINPVMAMEEAVKSSGLEMSLLHLVKIRASQINGCAYCVHMHTQEARQDGEREDRVHMVAAWWESSLYTPHERAALAWTDALTRLPDSHAGDDAYEPLGAQFTEAEIVKLTLAIATINVWNRLAVGFRFKHPGKWTASRAT